MTERRITVDGKSYDVAHLSATAREQIAKIAFCDQRLQQLSSQWAVADTARLAYSHALANEVKKP